MQLIGKCRCNGKVVRRNRLSEKIYRIIREDPDPAAPVKPYTEALKVDSHGSTLFGYALHPAFYDLDSTGPAILMLHGHPGGTKNMDLAEHFQSSGFTVIVFSYRGIWGSHGNYCLSHNDVDEGIHDGAPWGKYTFVSSWTDVAEESIPMWSMYSSSMSGIRIKLPKNPFRSYIMTETELSTIDPFIHVNGIFESIVPAQELFTKSYLLTTYNPNRILTPVIYDDAAFVENLRKEKIFNLSFSRESETSVHYEGSLLVENIGIYKSNHWTFQSEWRYLLRFLPTGFQELSTDEGRNLNIYKLQNLVPLPFNDYYLSLRDDAFEDMEILLGPKTTLADECIVRALVEKYNPAAKISTSTLKGHIR